MVKLMCVVLFAALTVANGVQEQSNYDISRNKLGSGGGFTLKDIADYFLGGYGQYNPDYPHYGQGHPNYPNQYPGNNYPGNNYPGNNYPGNNYPGNNYPGYYPGHKPGLPGPPGAHPGCPLCDSSVYSYCSYKQAHDACCCERSAYNYNCRKTDCKFLYANSCEEYNLISSCCCVDVNKNAIPVVPVVV